MEYKIPVENVEKFEKKIAKLAKKADKIGVMVSATFLRVVSEIFEKFVNGKKIKFVRLYNMYELVAPVVKINGWIFCAKITPEGSYNLIVGPKADAIPAYYRTATMVCEHCNINRRRNSVFILNNETTGEYKQVGSSCLAIFLGIDPKVIADYMTFMKSLNDDDSELREPSQYSDLIELHQIMAKAAMMTREYGFMGVQKAMDTDGCATINRIRAFDSPDSDYDCQIEDCDEEKATAVIEWMKTNINSDQTYLYNLAVIAEAGYCRFFKSDAIACSAVAAYHRAMEASQPRHVNPSKHLHSEGDKVTVSLMITGSQQFEGQFGVTTLISFKDSEGNSYKWFASGGISVVVGDEVTIKGTVKKNEVYKDTASTVLTRCKFV
jgi:hypothetical protein